ncbi:hypothetical protein BJV74DRAFT_883211 [Russula compacta]|nr:hypothetical protein BJV74DRAFT_883211 [Russula compacta]
MRPYETAAQIIFVGSIVNSALALPRAPSTNAQLERRIESPWITALKTGAAKGAAAGPVVLSIMLLEKHITSQGQSSSSGGGGGSGSSTDSGGTQNPTTNSTNTRRAFADIWELLHSRDAAEVGANASGRAGTTSKRVADHHPHKSASRGLAHLKDNDLKLLKYLSRRAIENLD